jgi:hypothetical protein
MANGSVPEGGFSPAIRAFTGTAFFDTNSTDEPQTSGFPFKLTNHLKFRVRSKTMPLGEEPRRATRAKLPA